MARPKDTESTATCVAQSTFIDGETGIKYGRGDEFTTSATRAKKLGEDLCKIKEIKGNPKVPPMSAPLVAGDPELQTR